MKFAIDASNLRTGGGVTHLKELLSAADPETSGISKVTVWGSRETLDNLPVRPWLIKVQEPPLEGSVFERLWWQRFRLPRLAAATCDVLFVPGGTYFGNFKPVVAMSRNLLPFDGRERARYGLSWTRLRLSLLRRGQTRTFRNSDGVIFLTKSAQEVVEKETGSLKNIRIIPHGICDKFRQEPRRQSPLDAFSMKQPFRWLYVSIVDLYKHQWHVAKAIATLRHEGMPVALDLVGPANPRALKHLNHTLHDIDPKGEIVRYFGEVPYNQLAHHYHGAEGFIFASSCENMPNILLEGMAAGLPIACSSVPPMPEVLGDAGIYFDPEKVDQIASALKRLMCDPELRGELAQKAYERAEQFAWKRCADETFAFLASVV